jgi:hypothetical protein
LRVLGEYWLALVNAGYTTRKGWLPRALVINETRLALEDARDVEASMAVSKYSSRESTRNGATDAQVAMNSHSALVIFALIWGGASRKVGGRIRQDRGGMINTVIARTQYELGNVKWLQEKMERLQEGNGDKQSGTETRSSHYRLAQTVHPQTAGTRTESYHGSPHSASQQSHHGHKETPGHVEILLD